MSLSNCCTQFPARRHTNSPPRGNEHSPCTHLCPVKNQGAPCLLFLVPTTKDCRLNVQVDGKAINEQEGVKSQFSNCVLCCQHRWQGYKRGGQKHTAESCAPLSIRFHSTGILQTSHLASTHILCCFLPLSASVLKSVLGVIDGELHITHLVSQFLFLSIHTHTRTPRGMQDTEEVALFSIKKREEGLACWWQAWDSQDTGKNGEKLSQRKEGGSFPPSPRSDMLLTYTVPGYPLTDRGQQ